MRSEMPCIQSNYLDLHIKNQFNLRTFTQGDDAVSNTGDAQIQCLLCLMTLKYHCWRGIQHQIIGNSSSSTYRLEHLIFVIAISSFCHPSASIHAIQCGHWPFKRAIKIPVDHLFWTLSSISYTYVKSQSHTMIRMSKFLGEKIF